MLTQRAKRTFYETVKRIEMAKNAKGLFQDVGLRNAVTGNVSPLRQRTDTGALLKNLVFSQISKREHGSDQIRFWRSQAKSEVDFVWQRGIDDLCPIEVKLTHRAGAPMPSGLRNFIKRYRPSSAFGVHLGEFYHFRFQDTEVYAVPAWALA